MKNFLLFTCTLLTLSLSTTQCGSKKKSTNVAVKTPDSSINCRPVQVLPNYKMSREWSSARIISSHILPSQCIALQYQYSGCQAGETLWIWNGETTDNQPFKPQLRVAEAGFCEMLIEARDTFSLAAWEQAAANSSFQFMLQGKAVQWPPQAEK